MTIEQRIERLESQNRRLRWTVAGLVASCGAALLLGAAKPSNSGEIPSLLRAHRIEVVAPDGKPAIMLGMTNDGTGTVSTLDTKGNKIVSLGVTLNGEGTVTTQNKKGHDLVKLGATTGGEGVILTHNAGGEKLLEIGVTTKGEPKIYTYKPDKSPRASWP